jgi:formylglycine-generating enzyme required for sulfatase activity
MYLYIELWKAKEAWHHLPADKRQAMIEELLYEAQNHPITGVVPVSVKSAGDVVLFDGVAEQPAVIDDRVARPTGYRYVSAYIIPTLELIEAFEQRVETLGWWFDYFDQVNAWGVMDASAVLGEMSGARPPEPLGPMESPTSFEGKMPGDELAGNSADRGQFCWCPPGRFKMGLNGLHVTLSHGFWMGKYEVTQAQYQRVMGVNPSAFVDPSQPVESVTKQEATAFCEKLTQLERGAGRLPEGWEVRLPTEAQWEYACRAGTTTRFYWGDDVNQADEYVWHIANSGFSTHPVGQKKPNAWGIYDMLGNALEICRDAYLDAPPSGVDPEVTERDLPARPGESDIPFGVSRGGGWVIPPEGCHVASRTRLGSGDRGYLLGFRVAIVRTQAKGHTPYSPSRAESISNGGLPPQALSDVNTETYPFPVVQQALDQVAYFSIYAVPDPSYHSHASLTPDNRDDWFGLNGGFGVDIRSLLHRFDSVVECHSGSEAVRVRQTVGESAGYYWGRWLFASGEAPWQPGSYPPPALFDPWRSQSFAMVDAEFTFETHMDGFRGYGIGQTFPVTTNGQPKLLVGGVGNLTQGSGKFEGLEGTYVFNGTLTPGLGFLGNITCRVEDPDGRLHTERELPALRPLAVEPEPDVSCIVLRGEKADRTVRTEYGPPPGDKLVSLVTLAQMRSAQYSFAGGAGQSLRCKMARGPIVAQLSASVTLNILAPPGTAAAPNFFTTRNVYTFCEPSGAEVGSLTADILVGKSFDLTFPSAPHQPGMRYGGFGPIVGGTGNFQGAKGLVSVNSAIGIAPHALSMLNLLRIVDTQGQYRKR